MHTFSTYTHKTHTYTSRIRTQTYHTHTHTHVTPHTGGGDVFVHQSSIHAEGFRSLAEGEPVEFEVCVVYGVCMYVCVWSVRVCM